MDKKKIIKNELLKKRDEMIISLYQYQEYNFSDIAFIFKLAHTTVSRIINKDESI